MSFLRTGTGSRSKLIVTEAELTMFMLTKGAKLCSHIQEDKDLMEQLIHQIPGSYEETRTIGCTSTNGQNGCNLTYQIDDNGNWYGYKLEPFLPEMK